MKRWVRRLLLALALTVAVLAGATFALHLAGGARIAKGPAITARAVAIPTDAAAITRGAHLAVAVTACTSCHSSDLSGQVLIDEAPFGRIVSANLTRGAGGFGATATVEDWVRAVRHGVGIDGRLLIAMPSDGFAHLSDEDLGAILAYIDSVPPVDNVLPASRLIFPGTVLGGFLMYDDLPARRIARMASPQRPAQGVTAEYGAYLLAISACSDCHGVDYQGIAPGTPGPPPGPDLTRAGALGSWTRNEFVHAMRTGVTPGGRTLSPDMPFVTFGKMTDDELGAMWVSLSTR